MRPLYHLSGLPVNTKVLSIDDSLDFMENPSETMGRRLARLREEAGLKQKDLAKVAGVRQTQISNIENDVRGYGANVAYIARALSTTPFYLLMEKGATRSAGDGGPSKEALTLARAFDRLATDDASKSSVMRALMEVLLDITGAQESATPPHPAPTHTPAATEKHGTAHA